MMLICLVHNYRQLQLRHILDIGQKATACDMQRTGLDIMVFFRLPSCNLVPQSCHQDTRGFSIAATPGSCNGISLSYIIIIEEISITSDSHVSIAYPRGFWLLGQLSSIILGQWVARAV